MQGLAGDLVEGFPDKLLRLPKLSEDSEIVFFDSYAPKGILLLITTSNVLHPMTMPALPTGTAEMPRLLLGLCVRE